jgi:putative ABC transport system ATP-binding protein
VSLASCNGVSVIHGAGDARVTALDNVAFAIEPGERTALFGPSGSGKTTLLHVLGGLIVPDAGEVRWRDQPLSSLDVVARGRTRSAGIAFVFQGANLLPTFTAYENVAFAAHASQSNGSTDQPQPLELLELVGLSAKAEALPSELSGGEAQRVAIARALAQRPALLLCDEPTGHLDTDTGARVLDLIDALHGEFGFGQVTATHDADVAARFDRAVGLADGKPAGTEQFT